MNTRVEVHLIEDPAIEQQIRGVIRTLEKRLQLVGAVGVWQGWSTRDLAATLAGKGADRHTMIGPSAAAAIVLNGLLDPRDATDPAFWGTPLGRVVAYWGTGEPATITRACAAAALGVTRQTVMNMLRDGRLSEPVNAGTDDLVTTASLAHAMRVRHPLGG